MSAEQTEKASPQKKKKAADKGDRLISRELIAATAMLCGVVSLGHVGKAWSSSWTAAFHASISLAFTFVTTGMSPLDVATVCRSIATKCLGPILVFALCSMAGALLMGIVQGGGQLTFAAIAPRWSRVNPGGHLKNIFGLQALVRLAKSLLPAAAIAAIAVARFRRLQTHPTGNLKVVSLLFFDVYDLLLGTAIAMLIWSGVDYVNAWRSREGRLKMSKQDVRDEAKESEGSPQIKRRIRQLQRHLRKRQLRVDVSKATVILTNPTHYAVALIFDFVSMDPPKVLAKGRDLLAKQIREDAMWAGVPIVENAALARSLYRAVEPGHTIPFELYAAVAGILAYLYRREMEVKARERAEEAAREKVPKPHATDRAMQTAAAPVNGLS